MKQDKLPNVVETYLVEEITELIYEDEKLDEWKDLVKQMKLSGQTVIAQPEKSPIPFIPMKRTLENVFRELCPRRVEIADYNISPIPLEVLKLVSMSTKENYFQRMEIWYDDEQLDPVAIGIMGHYQEETYYEDSNKSLKAVEFETKQAAVNAGAMHVEFKASQKYLIARWGDVKQSFAELAERAKERYMNRGKISAERKIKEAERELEDLKNDAGEKFVV